MASSAERADDDVAGGAQHPDDVGEVVLALRVLGVEAPQGGGQQAAPEAVDRRVDLGDLELGVVGVGLLHDAVDAAAGVAHDAPVSGRVVELGGEDGGRGVGQAVLGGELGERLGPQQRGVAGEDEDVVFAVEVEAGPGEADAGRVAGAALEALLDELDRDLGGELLLDRLGHRLGAVADDDHDAGQRQLHQPVERRGGSSAARRAGAAPSGSRSACGCPPRRRAPPRRAVGKPASSTPLHGMPLKSCDGVARGRGFEPRLGTPKDPVLPLHHPRQGSRESTLPRVPAPTAVARL